MTHVAASVAAVAAVKINCCPPSASLSSLFVSWLPPAQTRKIGRDITGRGGWKGSEMVDRARKRCLFYKERGRAPFFFLCATTSFFCSLFWSFFSVTIAPMALCLRVPLAAPRLSFPPSLTHSLFILGFTVSIPEGRSIACNGLSMKSPLRCWRKEAPLNRTLTLFLRSF